MWISFNDSFECFCIYFFPEYEGINEKSLKIYETQFDVTFENFLTFLKQLGKLMDQPSIKFLNQQFTYFIFIILIIISSVFITTDTLNTDKLSNILDSNFFENYTTYTLRTDIHQHFNFTDFSIRIGKPTYIDYLLLVWIIGLLFKYKS